jgi:hypothetical protein
MQTTHKFSQITVASLSAILLSGCYDTGQKLENCWSADTKPIVTKLASSIVVDHIMTIVKRETGQPVSAEKRAAVESNSTVTLTNSHVISKNKDADRLMCSTTVNFTLKRGDRAPLNGSTSAEYEISRGENGFVYSVGKASLIAMVNSSSE